MKLSNIYQRVELVRQRIRKSCHLVLLSGGVASWNIFMVVIKSERKRLVEKKPLWHKSQLANHLHIYLPNETTSLYFTAVRAIPLTHWPIDNEPTIYE